MTILVLDDECSRHTRFSEIFKEYFVFHSFNILGAKTYCLMFKINMLCIDHDLGSNETGAQFAKWLYENPIYCPNHILIHSQNPVGSNNIKDILLDVKERQITVKQLAFRSKT